MGVPLIVTPLFDQKALRPVGRFENNAPLAIVVLYVILVIAVLIQTVWESVPAADVKVIVSSGFTVIVPVAVADGQPPVVFIV